MLKYIYFGTPEISANVLESLVSLYGKPELVVSSPDAPVGRKLVITPSPVKVMAQNMGIPVLSEANLKDIESQIISTKAQVGVLFAYGKIIPKWLLDIFPYGIVNVHPSLLPLYRGASPLTAPILNGDMITGITIMDMDKELDHGPIYLQEQIDLNEYTTRLDLEDYVSKNAGRMLSRVLNMIESNTAQKTDQDHAIATYTTKIKKEDGLLTNEMSDEAKFRKYKAYLKWPGVYFINDSHGKNVRIKITKAHMENGVFTIDTVIPENSKETNYEQFMLSNVLK